MIVCLCRRVSDRDIRHAVNAGVRDFGQLQDDTGVARNCASCHECAKDIFDQACERSACTAPIPRVAPLHWMPAGT